LLFYFNTKGKGDRIYDCVSAMQSGHMYHIIAIINFTNILFSDKIDKLTNALKRFTEKEVVFNPSDSFLCS